MLPSTACRGRAAEGLPGAEHGAQTASNSIFGCFSPGPLSTCRRLHAHQDMTRHARNLRQCTCRRPDRCKGISGDVILRRPGAIGSGVLTLVARRNGRLHLHLLAPPLASATATHKHKTPHTQ